MLLELLSWICYIDTPTDAVDANKIQQILSSFRSYVIIVSHCGQTSTRKFWDLCSADNEEEINS